MKRSLAQNARDEHFMREALAEATIALEEGNWPVGCVIVLDDKIIARSHNQVYSLDNKISHAEIAAITQVSPILAKRGQEATLYVTIEPCPMCVGAVLLNHFARVVCGPDVNESGGFTVLKSLPNYFKQEKYAFEIDQSVLPAECTEVFWKGVPSQKPKKFTSGKQ